MAILHTPVNMLSKEVAIQNDPNLKVKQPIDQPSQHPG
jgi:hypothetical protein